jgi:hypothetical protein
VISYTGSDPRWPATVSPTSRVVHIVNHDRLTYRQFLVQSEIKPVITAAKPCGFVQRDGAFNGTTFNWRYRATCRKVLPPGKSFDFYLTTSGGGRIQVFVVVNGELVPIARRCRSRSLARQADGVV